MNMQIWNGKEWETKFISMNLSELEHIGKELEDVGFRAIVVGDGYMPKSRVNHTENIEKSIIEALLNENK